MRRLLPILLACSALALAGCGGDDEDTSAPAGGGGAESTPAASGDHTVAMKNIQFDPKEITVKVGESVTWVNEDSVDHDAVAKSGDVPKSELFGEGKSYTATFDEPGTIEYVCTVHPGMEGTVTVEQ